MIEEGRKKEREGVEGRARWELVFYLREVPGGERGGGCDGMGMGDKRHTHSLAVRYGGGR